MAKDGNNMPPFEVSGQVVAESGETLVGVTVTEKGTNNGVATDVNGKFKVRSGNAVLVVRYIGYQAKEVPVNNNNTLKIQLSNDSKTLNEVVALVYREKET